MSIINLKIDGVQKEIEVNEDDFRILMTMEAIKKAMEDGKIKTADDIEQLQFAMLERYE